VCFLFLDPQNEIGPSISCLVILCSFILLVYTVRLVLVFYLCPSSVRVVATFPGTVLFPLLYSVLPFFPLIHWFFSLSSFVIPYKCLKNFICAASKHCSSLCDMVPSPEITKYQIWKDSCTLKQYSWTLFNECTPYGGYTLVMLPRIVTPYCDGMDKTRARVTYRKLVTR